jgi:hypothetical protein
MEMHVHIAANILWERPKTVSFLVLRHTNGNKMSGPVMPATKPKRASSSIEDNPAQSKRFIDAARKAGSDETEEGAERTFKTVVSSKGPRKALSKGNS